VGGIDDIGAKFGLWEDEGLNIRRI
jgi:hypothetical protein